MHDNRDEAAKHSGQDARATRGRDARDTMGGSLKAAGFGDGRTLFYVTFLKGALK
jgi:hypothetical protein